MSKAPSFPLPLVKQYFKPFSHLLKQIRGVVLSISHEGQITLECFTVKNFTVNIDKPEAEATPEFVRLETTAENLYV